MTPTDPGWYWATLDISPPIRGIFQVVTWNRKELSGVYGNGHYRLDSFSDWSERLIDPKGEKT